MTGRVLSLEPEIDSVLETMATVAVVGLSPRPQRPSHRVAGAVQKAGVRIHPIHPCGGSILGEPVYPGLGRLPEPFAVDVIDVFRRPDALPRLVEEILAVYASAPRRPTVWFQLGVTHGEAVGRALEGGLDLVLERCLLIEHRRWRDAGGSGTR